jgi:phosphate transport system permease protein
LKTNFKQIKEKVIESILMLSSAATSITVVLYFFLFIEGAAVLIKNPSTRVFLLAVHDSNPVKI